MAAKKPFRYGALLRVRQRQEDLKSMALAEKRRAVHCAEQQRTELMEQQLVAFATAASLTAAEFDASDIRRYFLYERHLSRLAVEKDAEVTHLRVEEEERRGELEQAMKNRKILERLKERRNRAYDYALGKEEQKLLDETAVNRAVVTDRSRQR